MKLRHSEPYAPLRRKSYQPIGEQLDAIFKAFKAIEAQGVVFPEDVLQWLNHCEQVKAKFPKR